MSEGAKERQRGAAPGAVDEGTFEERLSRLGELVGRLEGGQVGLAESIGAYEQGVALVRSLQAELADVEQRVQALTTAAADAAAVPGDDQDADRPGPTPRKPAGRAARGAHGASAGTGERPVGPRARKLPGMDDGGADA